MITPVPRFGVSKCSPTAWTLGKRTSKRSSESSKPHCSRITSSTQCLSCASNLYSGGILENKCWPAPVSSLLRTFSLRLATVLGETPFTNENHFSSSPLGKLSSGSSVFFSPETIMKSEDINRFTPASARVGRAAFRRQYLAQRVPAENAPVPRLCARDGRC